MREDIYWPCFLDNVENIHQYREGGYHPVSIGQVMKGRRLYEIVHKLGYGGFATAWLARDLAFEQGKSTLGPLVCLKVVSSAESHHNVGASAEVIIPRMLLHNPALSGEARDFVRAHLLPIAEPFMEEGPNGSHICLATAVAGPSIFDVHGNIDMCGRMPGSVRLRFGLAYTVASQVVRFVHAMHSAGCVHGDLKSSNILFQLARDMPDWSNEAVYEKLGGLVAGDVQRYDGQPIGHSAPAKVVEPIKTTKFLETGIVDWERVAIIDFGQSYIIGQCPTDYVPATAPHYRAPESRFDLQCTSATDVWSLGCLLFEIRAGFPLFDPTWASGSLILVQYVNMLGKLPEPWWTSFTNRLEYFEENGDPKRKEDRTSIRAQLRSVGTWDSPSGGDWDNAPMFEPLGTRLSEHEIELLGDLVSKMVRYRPEERITMDEVVRHPWFSCRTPVVLARYSPEKHVAMEEVVPPWFLSQASVVSV